MAADDGGWCSARRSSDGQIILTGTAKASDHSSDLHFLVELRGFEPLTPSMRTRCATGLRYSPWNGCQRSKHRSMFALQSPTARFAASEYWS
jgi:hypothetical protein